MRRTRGEDFVRRRSSSESPFECVVVGAPAAIGWWGAAGWGGDSFWGGAPPRPPPPRRPPPRKTGGGGGRAGRGGGGRAPRRDIRLQPRHHGLDRHGLPFRDQNLGEHASRRSRNLRV